MKKAGMQPTFSMLTEKRRYRLNWLGLDRLVHQRSCRGDGGLFRQHRESQDSKMPIEGCHLVDSLPLHEDGTTGIRYRQVLLFELLIVLFRR